MKKVQRRKLHAQKSMGAKTPGAHKHTSVGFYQIFLCLLCTVQYPVQCRGYRQYEHRYHITRPVSEVHVKQSKAEVSYLASFRGLSIRFTMSVAERVIQNIRLENVGEYDRASSNSMIGLLSSSQPCLLLSAGCSSIILLWLFSSASLF